MPNVDGTYYNLAASHYDFPGVNDNAEPVLIQTFIAKSTVKALNKSVLHWLNLLDKPSFHTMLKSPLFQRAAVKFRPLVRSYRRRITSKQRNVVQNTLDLNACNPECDVNCQIPLREDVHTGQALDPPAGDERVYYEIHRSSQVGCRRAEQQQTLRCQTFTE